MRTVRMETAAFYGFSELGVQILPPTGHCLFFRFISSSAGVKRPCLCSGCLGSNSCKIIYTCDFLHKGGLTVLLVFIITGVFILDRPMQKQYLYSSFMHHFLYMAWMQHVPVLVSGNIHGRTSAEYLIITWLAGQRYTEITEHA